MYLICLEEEDRIKLSYAYVITIPYGSTSCCTQCVMHNKRNHTYCGHCFKFNWQYFLGEQPSSCITLGQTYPPQAAAILTLTLEYLSQEASI